uniref:Probable ATP-dependent transporter ycf16 n=1 Tax=Compsopogon caeruleus TaxID=31354 RepID=A0A7S1XHV2_9RHOD|mmetsp:Transcript_9941/g.20183  ORF Transcript_9941/g.20183 Transcript_9941/m.20183 type:complete len:951 (+) Transcript_9941:247-3099(+)|eukprot:CAMPEP_0184686518 /NCGR_PEP_ID=MMETSP0312-20130426/22751_1 /TAXON_ID=31354 /ORGANISM="Compsopogon coeruleus, Strain SAG 36.94" /LENGTH=950 /DNA_ID=CAMNT_0027141679 /DNA_START=208 /DNA_END=3060 /DNA_ORIENTATION=+
MDSSERGDGNSGRGRRKGLFGSQVRGFFVKTWHYQRRQYCENCWSFLIPALALILLQVLANTFSSTVTLPTEEEKNPVGGFAPLPFPPSLCLDNFGALTSGICLRERFAPAPVVFATVDETGDGKLGGVTFPECTDPTFRTCINARPAANASGILGNYSISPMEYPLFVSNELTPNNWSSALFNLFDEIGTGSVGNINSSELEMFANLTYQSVREAQKFQALDSIYGTRTVSFSTAEELESAFFDQFRVDGNVFAPFYGGLILHSASGLDPLDNGPIYINATFYYNETAGTTCFAGHCQLASGIERMINSLLKLFNGGFAQNFLRQFPKVPSTNAVDFISLIIAILVGIFLHFLIPGFSRLLIYERQAQIRSMMEMMGLRRSAYWFVTYCFFYAIYFVQILVMIIVGRALKIPLFTDNTPASWFVLLLIWGHTMIAWVMFLSPFFSDPGAGLIFHWFLNITINLIGGPFIGQLYTSDASEATFNQVSILPSFAMFRSLYYLGAFNTGKQGVTISDEYYGSVNLAMCNPGPFCISFGYLAVQWLLLLIAGLYLDRVLPVKNGIRDHPLFFLGFRRNGTFLGTRSNVSRVIGDGSAPSALTMMDEPEDVAAERVKAQSGTNSNGITIENLRKEFESSGQNKVAVAGLSLAIPRGEVFGLLGHNGAGKTTTISILTGILELSGGDAYLGGLSVRSDMKQIYRQMGVCPQFDRLWPELTGREHLNFYARVKGLRTAELKSEVSKALESVELTFAGNRQVKAYSGGMKRRLSVAISLIGEPEFVFLDEPTTGLDPKSKHNLWECLRNRKQGKTMILTTHSMEEAERLCDRVGIMASGRLRCVGPAEEIKLRLGRGYRLSVSLPPHNVEHLDELVRTISPQATVESSLAGSIIYQLPRDVVLSTIFVRIEESARQLGIFDWGISQSSLEDVFIELTQDEHRRAKSEYIETVGETNA